jgi:hypothetical protein
MTTARSPLPLPLLVDGIFFVDDANGVLDFRPLPPPTDEEVGDTLIVRAVPRGEEGERGVVPRTPVPSTRAFIPSTLGGSAHAIVTEAERGRPAWSSSHLQPPGKITPLP